MPMVRPMLRPLAGAALVVLVGASPAVAAGPASARPGGCPSTAPVALEVTAATPVDQYQVDTITACTDAGRTRTVLVNRGPAVWSFRTAVSYPARIDAGTRTSIGIGVLDSAVAGDLVAFPVLVPGSSITVQAPPEQVPFAVDPDLTVMWVAVDAAVNRVDGAARTAVFDRLRTRGPHRAAAITCALDSQAALESWLELDDGSPASSYLGPVLGSGATASRCVTQWNEANRLEGITSSFEPPAGLDARIQRADQRFSFFRSALSRGRVIVQMVLR